MESSDSGTSSMNGATEGKFLHGKSLNYMWIYLLVYIEIIQIMSRFDLPLG